MLVKFTRSSSEPEDPTIAIHRLLGLLESVVNEQAHLIEEITGPESGPLQELHRRVNSRQY
jgi:hypothetical protein